MTGPYESRLHRRRSPAASDAPPQRFHPPRGHYLTMANIRGPWRPSGAVAGAGLFAIVWTTYRGSFWAALHDFEPSAQLRLIEECQRLDRIAGFECAWPDGRFEG